MSAVQPNIPLLKGEDITQFENLELLAKQAVEGFIIGLHKSPFHGFSVEFAEHRLYNQGESTKNIDWKVYARTDKLFVKRFEEETNLRCQLVIDCSSSMFFPQNSDKINKFRFSAIAAAALMNLLKRQRDAFGLSLFDEKVEVHTDARSSTKHQNLLLSYLNQSWIEEKRGRKSNVAACLHEIADRIHKRSMVIIFSDMFSQNMDEDELNQICGALNHLKFAKHEVILFHVVDAKKELDFDFENKPYQFIDLETDEKVKLSGNEVKEIYARKMKEYEQKLKLKCLQHKVDFVEADIQQAFAQVLLPFLLKRSKLG